MRETNLTEMQYLNLMKEGKIEERRIRDVDMVFTDIDISLLKQVKQKIKRRR